ncbi:MAG: hypothetical protein ACJ77A_02410 [Actinomycetota bacterium]
MSRTEKFEARLTEALSASLKPGEQVQVWTLAMVGDAPGASFTLFGAAALAAKTWCYVALTDRRVFLVHCDSFWQPLEERVDDPAGQVRLEVVDRALFTEAIYHRPGGVDVPLTVQRKWRGRLEQMADMLRPA